MENTNIKNVVMRRVRTMHALRPLLGAGGFSLAVSVVSLFLIGRLVFVAQVFRNMPSLADIQGVATFFVSALLHTDTLVQLLVLAAVLAAIIAARSFAQTLAAVTRYA